MGFKRNRFASRTKKLKKEIKPFVLFYPHSTAKVEFDHQRYIRIVSVDPGSVNYAIRVELHDTLTGVITCEIFDRINLRDPTLRQVGSKVPSLCSISDEVLCGNLTKCLNLHRELLQDADIVIVEKQMSVNPVAMRIGQHTLSYFMTILADRPKQAMIYEINSHMKGKQLGAPKGCNLKLWSTKLATEILKNRGDQFSLDVLLYYKSKKDDLCDTLVQIVAFNIIQQFNKQCLGS